MAQGLRAVALLQEWLCCKSGFAGRPATPLWVSVAEARRLWSLPLLCIDLKLRPALQMPAAIQC